MEKTKHDPAFDPLHKCLDSAFRKLHNSGVGAKPKQARVITHDEEHTLWESSILGDKTPESLLHAVFYLNGLNFCLRGGEEHRQLKITQLQRMTVPDPDNPGQMIDCYEYTEFGSKNRSGGLNQVYLRNKGFRQYAAKNASRCHVRLIDLYLDKLPAYAFERDIFYCRPLQKYTQDGNWYAASPIGHNTLNAMLKTIFSKAEVDTENISNHSLRATAVTRMYEAGIPEKQIMERSGHLSLSGVRNYERTTEAQVKHVSKLLSNSESTVNAETKSKSPLGVNPPSLVPGPSMSEVPGLDKFQFQQMHGCTFNFTVAFSNK